MSEMKVQVTFFFHEISAHTRRVTNVLFYNQIPLNFIVKQAKLKTVKGYDLLSEFKMH